MSTNYRGYQYLRPALVLSPSGKAITRLADERICVVRLYETPDETAYYTSVINFISGEEELDKIPDDLDDLQDFLREAGLPVDPYWRIWIPLEWWQP